MNSYVLFKAGAVELQFANIAASNTQEYNLVKPNARKETGQFRNLKSAVGKVSDIAELTKADDVIYAAPFYVFEDGKEFPLTNVFYVELKTPHDIGMLENLAAQNNVIVVEKISLTENAYTLACTKNSAGNALEMANLFYETGLFLSSAPEFLSVEFESVNDTHFATQWNMNNTGQYGGIPGIDIGLIQARTLSAGWRDIMIAIIDEGVAANHPDLNIAHAHDAVRESNLNAVYGNHGTAVAGIIGARANNGDGVAGIAPNCELMSISTDHTTASLAYALRYAADNGAHVINNSWGASADMPAVNSAIEYALGKNCVVVFSAGNDGTPYVNYPKAAHPDILVVGAISYNGARKSLSTPDGERWSSNYGSALDVVAPGVLIPTTDRRGIEGYNPSTPLHVLLGGNKILSDFSDQDYTVWFGGTSAAAAHATGIAALLFSAYPSLTSKQVTDIIERTAQKVRPDMYTYSTTSGRPNGPWNQQMGYGLVDAYAAVNYAVNPPAPVYHNVTLTVDNATSLRRSVDIRISGNSLNDNRSVMLEPRVGSMAPIMLNLTTGSYTFYVYDWQAGFLEYRCQVDRSGYVAFMLMEVNAGGGVAIQSEGIEQEPLAVQKTARWSVTSSIPGSTYPVQLNAVTVSDSLAIPVAQ